ncbi:DUF6049 family protein [Ferrimicrobium sp.]|uniref:DUF6049 family protein n=1 Tax=Ferrimicrobium sp. TaxID=2926050 RepID=UPI00263011DB|nr:DUF6049 family protein [Ferrimicrobium sp.]
MSLLLRSSFVFILILLAFPLRSGSDLTAARAKVTLTQDVGILVNPQPLSLHFTWTGPSSNVEAFLVVYPSTSSRFQLRQTLKLGPSGSPLALSRPRALSSLGSSRGYDLTSRIFADLSCGTNCAGVYPVELRLANSQTGVTLDQLILGIPFLPSSTAVTAPLGVAPVLHFELSTTAKRVDAALSRLSSSPVAASISLGGAIGTSVALQKKYASLIGPSNLHQRIVSPYAAAATSCPRSPFSSFIGLRARLRLSGLINGTGSKTAVLYQHPTRHTLSVLGQQRIDSVVVPDGVLSQLASVLSVSDPAYIRSDGLTILGASGQLGNEFANADTPLGYQRLVADLAQFYFQAPAQSGRVAVMEVNLTTPGQIEDITTVLDHLGANPLLKSMTIQTAAALPSSQISLANLSLAPTPKHCSALTKEQRHRLARLSALASADSGSRDGLVGIIGLAQLATSSDSHAATQALPLLGQQEQELLDDVQLVGSKTITLTSHSVSVPLTLSSRLPFPIRVQLSIRSSEISFPKGSKRNMDLTKGTATVGLPVVVKALGTFAVTAVVSAPNGQVLITDVLTVHSTGFSTVGIVLTVGAALVLVSWWVRTARRHHKKTSTE